MIRFELCFSRSPINPVKKGSNLPKNRFADNIVPTSTGLNCRCLDKYTTKKGITINVPAFIIKAEQRSIFITGDRGLFITHITPWDFLYKLLYSQCIGLNYQRYLLFLKSLSSNESQIATIIIFPTGEAAKFSYQPLKKLVILTFNKIYNFVKINLQLKYKQYCILLSTLFKGWSYHELCWNESKRD